MSDRIHWQRFAAWALLLPVLCLCVSTVTIAANDITGSVRNQTRGEPSSGDQVILLRLEDMREEARAKTDPRGTFLFQLQYPGRQYLMRVIHDGVNYDQVASSARTVSISVFDAAQKVNGISYRIEILRIGTNGNLLHISDMLEVVNESNPPATRIGPHTLDVFLPAKARIDSVLAEGPAKTAVVISATPVPSEAGHYTVDFPLRPGATKFAFNFDMSYDGRLAFQSRHVYPLQQLAVMLPPTMKFSSPSPAFELLATGKSDYQVHAVNHVQAGAGPRFEVSGAGMFPPLAGHVQVPTRSQVAEPPLQPGSVPKRAGTLPALARAVSPSENSRPTWRWIAFSGLGCLIMMACLLFLQRTRRAQRPASAKRNTTRQPLLEQGALLLDLRRELSKLEADLNRGLITRREFDSTSRALLQAFERTAARVG